MLVDQVIADAGPPPRGPMTLTSRCTIHENRLMERSVVLAGPPARFALVFIKTVHTAIWGAVEGAAMYLLVTGVARRSGRGVAVAAANTIGVAGYIVYQGFIFIFIFIR